MDLETIAIGGPAVTAAIGIVGFVTRKMWLLLMEKPDPSKPKSGGYLVRMFEAHLDYVESNKAAQSLTAVELARLAGDTKQSHASMIESQRRLEEQLEVIQEASMSIAEQLDPTNTIRARVVSRTEANKRDLAKHKTRPTKTDNGKD